MKITDIECAVLLSPNCNVEACDSAQDTIVVEVRNDEGLTGIGEVDTNHWVAKAHIESPGSHLSRNPESRAEAAKYRWRLKTPTKTHSRHIPPQFPRL